MTKRTPLRATLLALCFAASAEGAAHADPIDRANSAVVDQAGQDNAAYLRQAGSANAGAITQTGNRNTACLYQMGRQLDGSIDQTGNDQSVAMIQTNAGTHMVPMQVCIAQATSLSPRQAFLNSQRARSQNIVRRR